MLKERARILSVAIFTLDLLLVSAAFLCAHGLRDTVLPRLAPQTFPSRLYSLADYLPLLPLALIIWGALLLSSGRYRSHRTVPLLEEAWGIIRVSLSGAIIFTLALYLTRLDERLLGADRISRFWALLFAVFSCLFLLTEKLALRLTSRYVRSHGFNYRTVLIVGTGPTALRLAESIQGHRFWGFRILGFIRNGDRLEDLFLSLQEQGIRTRFAMDLFPHTRARVELEELDGTPLLSFATVPNSQLKLMLKRTLD